MLPVMHLQQTQQVQNSSRDLRQRVEIHISDKLLPLRHMVFRTPLIPFITPLLVPRMCALMFYVEVTGAENNDRT